MVEDIISFSTGIYLSSSAQRFRFYEFLQDDGLLKLHFWADCNLQGKLQSGAVHVGFFPCVEYQNVGKLFQLFIGYL
jgi:hypothetical protein